MPDSLEKEILVRDRVCVYCSVKFGLSKEARKTNPTWEHIINDAKIITRENIARCCVACNSSKETKKLSDWFKSSYCKRKGINANTVAGVIKKALKNKARSIL
ncbi:MAG: HNH endonuclease [Candidatus Omnitrophica bacterium]|nr:HNH endonuclease [Candidatus Omnitrophota bacterium]MDD5440656.1 HNH endonuclease [Candidatus Omnitrophota bacterium]